MQNSIKLRRKALNMTQQQLADEAGIDRPRLCKIERGKARAGPEEILALARLLHCRPQDLGLEIEPLEPYSPEARELVRKYRKPPDYRHVHERSIESRFPALRYTYGVNVRKLMADPKMNRFMREAFYESGLESYFWAERPRLEGALPTEAAPLLCGFDLHPVVCPETKRVIGHVAVPAMVTPRWLAILQVAVTTPRYYRMDALLFTLEGGRRQTFDLELDGPGKPSVDPRRARDIGLRVIRFTVEEIQRGVTIDDKLDELGG